MRILSWNIRQGGGTRLAQIAEAICSQGPNVVVINEVSAARCAQLEAALDLAGFLHRTHTAPTGRDYGSLVGSRSPIELVSPGRPVTFSRHGLLDVRLPAFDVALGAVYGPMRSPTYDGFWNAMVDHAQAHKNNAYALVGDFNTGEALVDAKQRRFLGSRQFATIRELGYVDAWRAVNGDAREFTWFSRRGGADLNGFRIDQALLSPALAPRLEACRYSHEERTAKISDHSMLLLDIA